jgi:uncharacterized protein (DUF2252 family)
VTRRRPGQTARSPRRPLSLRRKSRQRASPSLRTRSGSPTVSRANATANLAAKAQKRTSLGSLARFAEKADGGYRIKPAPPVIVPVAEERREAVRELVEKALSQYVTTLSAERRMVVGHYRFVDIARKVSGVGSVGTDGYMVLLMGEREDDPLFLQFKEAQESVLAPYVGPAEHASQGERVVHGQRIMQATSDSFLGWYDAARPKKHFYARQLRDVKGSPRSPR